MTIKPNSRLNLLSYGKTTNGQQWYRVMTKNNKIGWVNKKNFVFVRGNNHLTAVLNRQQTKISGNTLPLAYVSTPEQPEINITRADKDGNYEISLINYNTDDTIYVVSNIWGYQDATAYVDFTGRYQKTKLMFDIM